MSSNFAQFIPLILIFVIFYFFLIRPQQKKVREHKTMTQNLKRGDEVITSGGIIGTVDRVFEDDRIELNISDGVKVQVIKNTIQGHLKNGARTGAAYMGVTAAGRHTSSMDNDAEEIVRKLFEPIIIENLSSDFK